MRAAPVTPRAAILAGAILRARQLATAPVPEPPIWRVISARAWPHGAQPCPDCRGRCPGPGIRDPFGQPLCPTCAGHARTH